MIQDTISDCRPQCLQGRSSSEAILKAHWADHLLPVSFVEPVCFLGPFYKRAPSKPANGQTGKPANGLTGKPANGLNLFYSNNRI
jgi:hypothetical protein